MIPKSAGFVPPPREVWWGGEHPGLPQQSAGGAERGRGQAEVGAGSRRAGNCTGRVFGVPQPYGAVAGTQGWGRARRHRSLPARAAEGSGGELAGKQRGSTPRGAAGTFQGPSRVTATPKTLPPGLCPAPQLLAAPLGKRQGKSPRRCFASCFAPCPARPPSPAGCSAPAHLEERPHTPPSAPLTGGTSPCDARV